MEPVKKKQRTVLVQYPQHQRYVVHSLRQAFGKLAGWTFAETRTELEDGIVPDLQWSDYDEIDWDELTAERLVNSYVIRKGLIRKNHLAHTTALYLSKHPTSILHRSVPRTFFFNLSFPDEMEELLLDELCDVEQAFRDVEVKGEEPKWWILKAALADKGNGIRLFSTRQQLEDILEEFEPLSDDEEEDEDATGYNDGTRVDSSQLREWVIQEYVSSPLLLDPAPDGNSHGHKFHLRVYVVAVGGLTVHVHHPFLALFAPTPYSLPSSGSTASVDLSSHLTNTCLQNAVLGGGRDELAVSTLQAMAGQKRILGGPHQGEMLSDDRVKSIEGQVAETVADVFKAAVAAGTSFQPLPNAFEIFGVDFLVDDGMNVSLLEVNACPDFAQTGSELQGVIDHLFKCTIETAVLPFFRDDRESELELADKLHLDERDGLHQVMTMEVSKAW